MAEINAQLVKKLRDLTGAGFADCKKALDKTGGDIDKAVDELRKAGVASASKKAERAAKQGVIGTYVHPGSQLGVLVEVNCESDFVARTDDFQDLVKDLAMQVAAADPKFIRREEVTPEVLEKEREIARDRAKNEGKPEKIWDKIIDGRLEKYYEEVCLMEQPFIKENTLTIGDLVKQKIAKLGENIVVARFARFKVGETAAATAAASE